MLAGELRCSRVREELASDIGKSQLLVDFEKEDGDDSLLLKCTGTALCVAGRSLPSQDMLEDIRLRSVDSRNLTFGAWWYA